jgi:hypothetical protein
MNVTIGQPFSHTSTTCSGTRANIAVKIFGDDLASACVCQAGAAVSNRRAVDVSTNQMEIPTVRVTYNRPGFARHGLGAARSPGLQPPGAAGREILEGRCLPARRPLRRRGRDLDTIRRRRSTRLRRPNPWRRWRIFARTAGRIISRENVNVRSWSSAMSPARTCRG